MVWCQGCPWRCRYCHNGHLVKSGVPATHSWKEVLAFLQRRSGLLDGVVFSGGEPTLQKALPEAIADVQALGFDVGLHTAGCYPDRLAQVLPCVDWVGLDIKSLPDDYAALTGVAGGGVAAWRSLDLLLDSGVAHEVRVTVHDVIQPLEHTATLVRRLVSRGVRSVVLQRCNTQKTLDPALSGQHGACTESGFLSRLAARFPVVSLRF